MQRETIYAPQFPAMSQDPNTAPFTTCPFLASPPSSPLSGRAWPFLLLTPAFQVRIKLYDWSKLRVMISSYSVRGWSPEIRSWHFASYYLGKAVVRSIFLSSKSRPVLSIFLEYSPQLLDIFQTRTQERALVQLASNALGSTRIHSTSHNTATLV